MKNQLTFGKGNAKLGKDVYTFSLPAGHTCPFAQDCLSKANRSTGKIEDGPKTKYRCFAVSQEARYRNVRDSRWRNFELLRACRSSADRMAQLILASLPEKARKVRIHVSGDFFSQEYFNAWVMVALERPNVTFYGYTKSVRYWINTHLFHIHNEPTNLVLTASDGTRDKNLVESYGLRQAVVVFSEAEAEDYAMEIDHDDSLAMNHGPSFALLLHGTQPKGSEAAKALQELKNAGHTGYGRKS